jgi:hypothetical protein
MYPDSYACAVVIEYQHASCYPGPGLGRLPPLRAAHRRCDRERAEDAMYRILKWLDPKKVALHTDHTGAAGLLCTLCP